MVRTCKHGQWYLFASIELNNDIKNLVVADLFLLGIPYQQSENRLLQAVLSHNLLATCIATIMQPTVKSNVANYSERCYTHLGNIIDNICCLMCVYLLVNFHMLL